MDCRIWRFEICRRYSHHREQSLSGISSAVNKCMTPQEMRDRTDRFSVSIIEFCRSKIPCDVLMLRLLTQLQDAATSVASNYHAACRAQSRAQFVAKLSIAVEEADECVGWLHKLSAARLASLSELAPLHQEASELTAILAASRKTASGRRHPPEGRRR
jgi:four helix bundle protein